MFQPKLTAFLILSLFIHLAGGQTEVITVDISCSNIAFAEQIAQIYQSRLAVYCEAQCSFDIEQKDAEISIELKGKIDTTALREVLASQGHLEVRETQKSIFLVDSLAKMNQWMIDHPHIQQELGIDSMQDSSLLYSIIYPSFKFRYYTDTPILGFVKTTNQNLFYQLLAKDEFQRFIPRDLELMWYKPEDQNIDTAYRHIVIVKQQTSAPRIHSVMIKGVRLSEDNQGWPMLAFDLKKEFVDNWTRMTAKNINKYLAIIIDGEVYSDPQVYGSVEGGIIGLAGLKSEKAARLLFTILNAGPLPEAVAVSMSTRQ